MAIRFTDTDKWTDSWFSSLSAKGKLMFMFLCENCNIAGIIEVNKHMWSMFTSLSVTDVDKALIEIKKCYVLSIDGECLFIRNFLKHQKNYPINISNKAHVKILSLYEMYKHKFDNHDIGELFYIDSIRGIEGGSKGDQSPTGIGIGIDNGIKGGVGEKEKSSKEKEFDRFNEWIDANISAIRQIKNQITYKEYCRITERYNGEQIRYVLTKIANYKLSPKKYSYVNLTFYDWAKKEYG